MSCHTHMPRATKADENLYFNKVLVIRKHKPWLKPDGTLFGRQGYFKPSTRDSQ
jgi:hypothetical protein